MQVFIKNISLVKKTPLLKQRFQNGSQIKNRNVASFFSRWNHKIEPRQNLRWAIAPISLVGDDFATALRTLPKDQHSIVACAACYKSQAEAFAKKHNIPKTFTSYYELAESKDIDVVYISPQNSMHLELGDLMLSHGKHVLCSAPLCATQEQAIQLIGKSHFKGCFLMEAMWSRFLPAYHFIRKQIQRKELGEIYDVDCTYGVPMMNSDRALKSSMGDGVTFDLGIYPIQLIQMLYRLQPLKVKATGVLNDEGVDIEANIQLEYSCERSASICLSSIKHFENVATIRGTKGEMVIPDYWCPTKIICNGFVHMFRLPRSETETIFFNRVGMCYQAAEVRQCLLQRLSQSDKMTHNESLLISNICDRIRRQIGVQMPEDEENLIEFECRQ